MGFFDSVLGFAGNIFGANKASDAAADAAASNAAFQKEFAQHGIQWRVADAKAAGIHPLAALGAQIASPGPIAVGDNSGEFLARAGQDIGRAVDAVASRGERHAVRMAALLEERGELENALLRSQIAKLSSSPPAFPSPLDDALIPGQGEAMVPKPLEPIASSPGRPAKEAGAVTDYQFSRTDDGWAVTPSNDVKQRIEDVAPAEIGWALRNLLVPPSPPAAPPRGKEWRWNPFTQSYRAVTKRPQTTGFKRFKEFYFGQ